MDKKIYDFSGIDIEKQIENVLDLLPITSTDYRVIERFLEEYLNQIETAFEFLTPEAAETAYRSAITFLNTCDRFLLVQDADRICTLQLLVHFIYTQAKEFYLEIEA